MAHSIEIYDTTLRDGSQGEGLSFSLADKLNLTRVIDSLGVHYIEGGWPGSNPKDMEYFEAVQGIKLENASIVAFGSTRHARNTAPEDANIRRLIESKAPIVTIVGKSWDTAVREALRVNLEENLDMIASSVRYLKEHVDQVFFDAEHFFDGYNENPRYAMEALAAAAQAGAAALVLCDTNGGNLPSRISQITLEVVEAFPRLTIGIHAHNDSGMAVANSVEAVRAGATHVQGTMNGFGERTGNADLVQILPNLELKMGKHCIGESCLQRLTKISRHVYEVANLPPVDSQPFVGRSAFAHKGGLHVSAISRNVSTYEHIDPDSVGNHRRVLISELSGRSNILARAKTDLEPEKVTEVLETIMNLENQGYAFENAEASFDLLVRKCAGEHKPWFKLKTFRVITESDWNGRRVSEAMVKVEAAGEEYHTVGEGDQGPVNAIDQALKKALQPVYPVLQDLRLVDYKVHIVNAQAAAAAKVRVVIRSADQNDVWGTVGVSENIIEATCLALVDSIEYMLGKNGAPHQKQVKGIGSPAIFV